MRIPGFSWAGLFRSQERQSVPPAEVVVELGGFGEPRVQQADLNAWAEESGPR